MHRILRLITSAAPSWWTLQTRSDWLLAAVLALSAASLAQAAPTPFIPTGSMTAARCCGQTATLLPNGQVLVAAGQDSRGGIFSTTELYDPSTGIWTATGSLADVRFAHTATLLPNGQVLVVGGGNFSRLLSTAELYDPSTGTWSATGSMANARYLHSATLLPNGQVLVAGGGYGVILSSAELYDPSTGTWTVTGLMNSVRLGHTATLLSNGQVLVAGGWNDIVSLTSAELYDPATGSWTFTGPMHAARGGHTATLLTNGNVLVAGGQDGPNDNVHFATAELYDPATRTWTATGSLLKPFGHHAATLLPNGQLLVAGGGGNGLLLFANAELYDPAIGTWTATGPMSTNRTGPTATLLPNGQVLVSGGQDGDSSALSSAELYDFHWPVLLNSAAKLPGDAFQFAFDNVPGASFTVLATTNLSLALSNWTVLGPPTESPAGHFQFSDPQATNHARRFYRVRSP